jgi:hypothetical protein
MTRLCCVINGGVGFFGGSVNAHLLSELSDLKAQVRAQHIVHILWILADLETRSTRQALRPVRFIRSGFALHIRAWSGESVWPYQVHIQCHRVVSVHHIRLRAR